MIILKKIEADFIAICCNKRGTHTIQKFIDLVNLEQEEKFFQRVLRGHVLELSYDSQGTHVVQNIIRCFPEHKREVIFEEVYANFFEAATRNYSVCVVKVLIAKTQNLGKREKLIKKIKDNIMELAQNPFGNYAIQEAFMNWDRDYVQCLIQLFFNKIY